VPRFVARAAPPLPFCYPRGELGNGDADVVDTARTAAVSPAASVPGGTTAVTVAVAPKNSPPTVAATPSVVPPTSTPAS
jgi:hypothetical protein